MYIDIIYTYNIPSFCYLFSLGNFVTFSHDFLFFLDIGVN